MAQTMGHRVQQRSEDAGSHCIELCPDLALWSALLLGNRFEPYKDRAVGKIAARHDVLDPG